MKGETLYDFKSAEEAGLKPDKTGHWPSRVPNGKKEGLILKASRHPTFYKTVQAEVKLGNRIYVHRPSGKLYSFSKSKPLSDDFHPIDPTKYVKSQKFLAAIEDARDKKGHAR